MADARLPDRYTSPRLVARGGMGEIYLAEDVVLGRRVAVKVLDERFSRDNQVRRRFKREALTQAKLSGHPHIVTIFDVGEHEGRPFMVMEYLAGGTVADRASEDPVARDEALSWLGQAASALDEAHAAGVIHRDVKPANLLLDERQSVHVGDFGIARVVDEATFGMTAAGTVLGTAGYLSPEQARGERATAASDVYSLGVVAFELLTGSRPFERGSATEEAAAHLNEPVPPASERASDLPPSVDDVLARALAKHPSERYPRASHFVQALEQALAPRLEPEVAPVAAPVIGPRRVERRPRYLPALLIGLALAALAAGGVVAAVVTAGDGSEEQATPTQEVRTVTQATTVQGEPTTVIQTTTAEAPATQEEPVPVGGGNVSYDDAVALTDQASGLMREGNYRDALRLALRAYRSLQGSGDIYEAYAAYDAGRSYVELGNCRKGVPLLDESERIQGQRNEIDAARAQCSSEGGEG